MEIKIQETNPTLCTVTVIIPPELLRSTYKDVFEMFVEELSIPGFRKGKAPANLIRKMYNERIVKEHQERLIKKAYEYIEKENSIDIYRLLSAQCDVESMDTSVDICFEIETIPKFVTPDWKSIKLEIVPITVSEEEIEKGLQVILNKHPRLQKCEEPISQGDRVTFSFEGKVDGVPIIELEPKASRIASNSSAWLILEREESSDVFDVFSKGLLGIKTGETIQIEYTFPSDYFLNKLSDKKAEYTVTVKEVHRVLPAEVNKFLFDAYNVKDEAELRELIRKTIEKNKKLMEYNLMCQKMVETLCAGMDFPVPESRLKLGILELHSVINRDLKNEGISLKENDPHIEEIKELALKQATSDIRKELILDRIGRELNVSINSAEVYDEVQRMSNMSDIPIQKILKDEFSILAARTRAFQNKTVEVIVDQLTSVS